LGVWDRSLVERVASALALLGVEQAWIVHGADGLDEVTITGETFVAACSKHTGVKTFTISPEDFGLQRRSFNQCHPEGPIENAQLIRAILNGETNRGFDVARDVVIANAAAGLHLAAIAPDLRQAARIAGESIHSGRASSKLDALIQETNRNR
jgi:anthranilate phosphoribosyltransferase